ncbi:Protein regulator of cytokinesis 1 [Halotydeus destructor]|nr:Protein regulator of cytokinesis 1 [Halotydeus destructor]
MDPRLNEDFLNILEGDDDTLLEPDELVKSGVALVEHDLKESMHKVADIWIKLGLPSRRRDQRVEEISDLIKETLKDVVSIEQEALDNMIAYKDTRFKQINEMLSDLHLPYYELPTSSCLFAVGKQLHCKFDELKKVKDERMDQLCSLREKRDEICKYLGEEPDFLRLKTNIPSEEELVDLRTYVSKLSSELNKRKDRYSKVKQAIEELVYELEYETNDPFEKEVLVPDQNIALSKSNLNKSIEFHQKLERQSVQNKARKGEMIARLTYLWDKLSVEEDMRIEVISAYSLNSQKTLDALQANEVEKYEVMRKERLGEFITAIIPEVVDWWEKCFVPEDEQEIVTSQFNQLPTNSEEQLEAWEKELKGRQDYFASNQKIFNDIQLWKTSWEEMAKIEAHEKDPERFKTRRVPSTLLMKEQQEKRKHENRIKKLEKELISLSKTLEIQGTPFMVGSEMLDTFIMGRRENYDQAKVAEKEMKKMEKQFQLQLEMRGVKNMPKGGLVLRKTPVKRNGTGLGSGMGTPLSPAKLRRFNEQVPSNTKLPGGIISKPSTLTKPPRTRTQTKLPRVAQLTPSTGATGSQQSLLSVDEEAFQADLKQRKARLGINNLNSTYVRNDIDNLRI